MSWGEIRLSLRRVSPHWPIGLLALLVVVFYWDLLMGSVFLWEDGLTSYYPVTRYFCARIFAGEFPFWAPGMSDGFPFYADPQMLTFYPLNWLLLLFSKGGELSCLVYQRLLVFEVLLGGAFFYLLMDEYGLRPAATIAGMVVFCFSGFMSLHFKHAAQFQVYVWFPLELLLIKRLVSRFHPWRFVSLLGAISLSLLAGHTQITVYASCAAAGFWLFCLASREGAPTRNLAAGLAQIIGTFFLACLLNAFLVLPAIEGYRNSWRRAWDRAEAVDQSLPIYHLAELAVPNFFGTTEDGGSPMPYWGFARDSRLVQQKGGAGSWQYWEFSGYAGQAALLAFLIALFSWPVMRQRRLVVFLLGAWFFGLAYMLGRHVGLVNLLAEVLPVLGRFRIPTRMVFLVDFSFAALTAVVLDALQNREPLALRWPIAALGAIHIVLRLSAPEKYAAAQSTGAMELFLLTAACFLLISVAEGKLTKAAALAGVIGLCFFDLHAAFGRFHRGKADPEKFFADRLDLARQLGALERESGPTRFGQAQDGILTGDIVFPHNFALVHPGLEFSDGDTTFNLANVEAFQKMTNEPAKMDIQNMRVLANVNTATRQLWIDTRSQALPRAKFYSRVKTFASRAMILRALEDKSLDYQNEVGALASDFRGLNSLEPPAKAPGTQGFVRWTRESSRHTSLRS